MPEKRLLQLLRRIADGEKFTVNEAADVVFLPGEVFRYLWVAVLSSDELEATIQAARRCHPKLVVRWNPPLSSRRHRRA
jgi:hypothetical protein